MGKLTFIPFLVFGGMEAVKGGAETIVLAAATVAALIYLWVKLVRPAKHFVNSVRDGLGLLETLPERLDTIDSRIDVIAEANRHRIEDALAGDRRTPIDRRKH